MTSGRLGQGTGQQFGSDWISGVLGVTCGALGYGGVLCLLFPSWLTTYWRQLVWPFRGATGAPQARTRSDFGS